MKYNLTREQVEALANGEVVSFSPMSFRASNRTREICNSILRKNLTNSFTTIIERGVITTNIYLVPTRKMRKRKKVS